MNTKPPPVRSLFYPWRVIKPPRTPRPKPKIATDPQRDRLFAENAGLFHHCAKRLFPYSNPLRDPAVSAEDFVSDLMLTAARRFHKFDPKRGKFSTWLNLIAFAVAHRLRTRALATQRLAANQTPIDDFDLFHAIPDPRQHEPWEIAFARELAECHATELVPSEVTQS